jgi:hypothetical protein
MIKRRRPTRRLKCHITSSLPDADVANSVEAAIEVASRRWPGKVIWLCGTRALQIFSPMCPGGTPCESLRTHGMRRWVMMLLCVWR